jgi:hypothetical protein
MSYTLSWLMKPSPPVWEGRNQIQEDEDMAQYTVHHACGHDVIVTLFGPHVERENKIRWMEGNDCPKCWGTKEREKEAQMPIAMAIRFNGLDTDADGNPVAEIVLTGGTAPRKEEIKSMGYSFREVRGGIMDFLSATRAPMAWVRTVPMVELFDGTEKGLNDCRKRIETDATQLRAAVDMKVSPLDLEMARKKLAEKSAKDAMLANLTKPVRPEGIFPEPGTGKWSWNGKVYGNNAKYGCRIYIQYGDSRDGDEMKLTPEQAEKLNAFIAAKAEYKAAVERINAETKVEADG